MLLIRRAFSQLSVELSKGISPLILACSSSDFTHSEDFLVYPKAISELLKYQRTNDAIHKLIQNHITHTKSPVILDETSYSDALKYLNYSLIARDMQALDSAIHLLWHSFPERKFPLAPIVNTLVVTKPLGTEENQKLWRKLVSQMAFYALPNKISPAMVREFFTNYGKYPENYLLIIKYAMFTNDEKNVHKFNEKMGELNVSVEDYLNYDFEMEIKGIDRKTNAVDKYIKSKFMTKEEETEFRSITDTIKGQLATSDWFNTRFEGYIASDIAEREFVKGVDKKTLKRLEDFYDNYAKKRTYKNEIKSAPSENNLINKFISKPLQEWSDLMKQMYFVDQEYQFQEYQMTELLANCLEYCRPGLEDFEHLEKWLAKLLTKNVQFYIPEYCFTSLVYHALRHDKDDFICFLYNNFSKLAVCEMPPLLLVEIVRIIANNDTIGKHVEAVGSIIKASESLFLEKKHLVGLLGYETVADNFLLCFLKDKRLDDAKMFAYEMGLFGYEFDEDLLDPILEYLYENKDGNGILMLNTLKLSLIFRNKLVNYMKILRDEAEKEGKFYDLKFSSYKYYTKPSEYMHTYIQPELNLLQRYKANIEKKNKERISKLRGEDEEEERVKGVEEELEVEEIDKDSKE